MQTLKIVRPDVFSAAHIEIAKKFGRRIEKPVYRYRDLMHRPWNLEEYAENRKTAGRRMIREVWIQSKQRWESTDRQPQKACDLVLATYRIDPGKLKGLRFNAIVSRSFGRTKAERLSLLKVWIDYETKWQEQLAEMELVVRVTATGLSVTR